MAKRELQTLMVEQKILNKIYVIRGEKVMLDRDLAEMYGVQTKVLNQSIKRNLNRFPKDFMFQLSQKEYKNLKSQFVTSRLQRIRNSPVPGTRLVIAKKAAPINSEAAFSIYSTLAFIIYPSSQITY